MPFHHLGVHLFYTYLSQPRTTQVQDSNNEKRKFELKIILNDFKSKPCMDCNKSFPTYAMDLDHRDINLKSFSISDLLHRFVPLERFRSELEKCDVVCAICHRHRTFSKKQYLERPERVYHRRTRSALRISQKQIRSDQLQVGKIPVQK